jgi:hypothetical protein
VLLVMIFIVGRVWPGATPAPDDEASASAEMPPANSTALRIHSARKWPDKIQFDTSVPTIVPPPAPPVVAAVAPPAAPTVAESQQPAASPLEARAEMKHAAPPPKRTARVHRRSVRPDYSTWAYASPAAQPRWSSWSSSPRWSWNW